MKREMQELRLQILALGGNVSDLALVCNNDGGDNDALTKKNTSENQSSNTNHSHADAGNDTSNRHTNQWRQQ